MHRTFVHRPFEPTDPAFLREERQFLERQWGVLHTMEREREHLTRDIERARSLAARIGVRVDSEIERKEEPRLLSLIGIGNRFRRDDAAGLEVVRRLRLAHPPGVKLIEEEGEPASLIEAWSSVDEALVVDGDRLRLRRREGSTALTSPPRRSRRRSSIASTHALGLPEAVELARELDRLPESTDRLRDRGRELRDR